MERPRTAVGWRTVKAPAMLPRRSRSPSSTCGCVAPCPLQRERVYSYVSAFRERLSQQEGLVESPPPKPTHMQRHRDENVMIDRERTVSRQEVAKRFGETYITTILVAMEDNRQRARCAFSLSVGGAGSQPIERRGLHQTAPTSMIGMRRGERHAARWAHRRPHITDRGRHRPGTTQGVQSSAGKQDSEGETVR